MKKLVSSLLKSIPELLTVVAFLSFLFFLYGVIGVQMWSGVLHHRCRLTPYPVRLDPEVTFSTLSAYQDRVLQNYSFYPCVDKYNQPIPMEDGSSQINSPWHTPRLCYWPIANESPAHGCAIGDSSFRRCPVNQTCGSDYDGYGNFRFTHPDHNIVKRVLHMAVLNYDMRWGYINFDNIMTASLNIFVCITRDGWYVH